MVAEVEAGQEGMKQPLQAHQTLVEAEGLLLWVLQAVREL
jgi:hypothetical protein